LPKFRSALHASPYPDGCTWYLDRPLVYARKYGVIRVPSGFETDFASVPALFTNLFPRWDVYGPASVIHDWLYWNQQTDRKTADDIFLEAMACLGVPPWKRRTLHSAVRWFGIAAWDDNARIAGEGYSRIRVPGAKSQPWDRQA